MSCTTRLCHVIKSNKKIKHLTRALNYMVRKGTKSSAEKKQKKKLCHVIWQQKPYFLLLSRVTTSYPPFTDVLFLHFCYIVACIQCGRQLLSAHPLPPPPCCCCHRRTKRHHSSQARPADCSTMHKKTLVYETIFNCSNVITISKHRPVISWARWGTQCFQRKCFSCSHEWNSWPPQVCARFVFSLCFHYPPAATIFFPAVMSLCYSILFCFVFGPKIS